MCCVVSNIWRFDSGQGMSICEVCMLFGGFGQFGWFGGVIGVVGVLIHNKGGGDGITGNHDEGVGGGDVLSMVSSTFLDDDEVVGGKVGGR